MKLTGYLKGKGKLGNMVCAQIAGVTIGRDYNPNVKNPNTALQVAQRSNFKLASQVTAALAPVIAIPREGLKSARNLFIKKNKALFIAGLEESRVALTDLQLTAGSIAVPEIRVSRDDVRIIARFVESVDHVVDRVVWVIYAVESTQLRYLSSDVVDITDDNSDGETIVTAYEGKVVVYGYGIKDKDAGMKTVYNNYKVVSGEDVATLIANRTINTGNTILSKTRGVVLEANENEKTSVSGTKFIVTKGTIGSHMDVTISNDGIIPEGQSCTLTATAGSGYAFGGWSINGGSWINQNPYTFVPTGDCVVDARSEAVVNP